MRKIMRNRASFSELDVNKFLGTFLGAFFGYIIPIALIIFPFE
jgi:hypothetical protein